MIGVTPVLVDVEPETLCLSFELTKNAITPKTKAIIFVSANGRYPLAGIESFQALCRENGLVLIEDSAQSLGSLYPNKKHIGTIGTVGSFSFSAPKIISTGQGGALVTNEDGVADRLRKLKDFGRTGGGNDVHEVIGYNSKFTDIQAVLGIEQMKKLPWRVERKKEISKLYRDFLSPVKQVRSFTHDLEKLSVVMVERDG